MGLSFKCVTFNQLTLKELYAILALRAEVFVVEQNCPFQDPDGQDLVAWHCLGTSESGQLLAYTRLFDKDVSFAGYASIGRVVTSPSARATGMGKQLMQVSIDYCQQLFGPMPIKIGAQTYLLRFYESLGFVSTGKTYLEDNIPHIKMVMESCI
ncbi:MAG: GNAT family N-acetyltransferase [Cytophagia bacterium]|nr:MAG: GNAT family N-acetyltransferase [Runella sp.]TAG19642.1 MAG: GNAT family N-acetyltransferase [Cytophagales bacterium]TAG40197.1 MAG: GNAT family N-acetyltransferase [Cytophagia bacterium]TAG67864.1 MAG: GNAT family N-acetyltransferase [Runella slithyformis]TAG80436.1 MAG: GNAT family N-acetyltransferase [Cytophagales bacterium]